MPFRPWSMHTSQLSLPTPCLCRVVPLRCSSSVRMSRSLGETEQRCVSWNSALGWQGGVHVPSPLAVALHSPCECALPSVPCMQSVTDAVRGYIGAHGRSKVHLLVWYSEFNDLCFVPFAHAFYRGVFKDLMLTCLSTQEALRAKEKNSTSLHPIPGKAPFYMSPDDGLTRQQRKECTDRMRTFVFTNDFDRPPECPVTHGASQVMEQLMRQPDCVMPLLFVEVRGGLRTATLALQVYLLPACRYCATAQ